MQMNEGLKKKLISLSGILTVKKKMLNLLCFQRGCDHILSNNRYVLRCNSLKIQRWDTRKCLNDFIFVWYFVNGYQK